MKKYIIGLFLLALFSFAKNTRQSHSCSTKSGKFTYQTKDGRIDGKYVSYYTNGKKKAEGSFKNNCRFGTWTLWDSTGNMLVKREYADAFTVKQVFPKTDKGFPGFVPQENAEGFYDYSTIKEEEVAWSKRIWRFIEPANNPELFIGNHLFGVIHKNILAKKLEVYSAEKDDEFRNKLTAPGDTATFRIIGYKIKEDVYYHNVRCISETRIIGFCPVAVDKQTNDTVNMYWIYMPDARKLLAAENVKSKSLPADVKTLDDLFFFRCFSGMIYRETNIYDRTIANYTVKTKRAEEAERIEMEIIEAEHDFWTGTVK